MGKTERSNGAFGKSDIEGKTAREAASELGKERVSNGLEHMSQRGQQTSFKPFLRPSQNPQLSALNCFVCRRARSRRADAIIVFSRSQPSEIFFDLNGTRYSKQPVLSRALQPKWQSGRLPFFGDEAANGVDHGQGCLDCVFWCGEIDFIQPTNLGSAEMNEVRW